MEPTSHNGDVTAAYIKLRRARLGQAVGKLGDGGDGGLCVPLTRGFLRLSGSDLRFEIK